LRILPAFYLHFTSHFVHIFKTLFYTHFNFHFITFTRLKKTEKSRRFRRNFGREVF